MCREVSHEQLVLVLTEFACRGVKLVYLPPYSPDFNPIEEAFSKIKKFIRRNGSLIGKSKALFFDMYCCMHIITPEDALGYFRHSGYV